ncbi:MAG: hypothetical protein ACLQVI_38335 [Polyangiaceae bacterium]|jgi:hypothetical protein
MRSAKDGVSGGKCAGALVPLAVLALTACSMAPTSSPDDLLPGSEYSAPSSASVDEAAILASIARGAFRESGAFVKVTNAPYPSVAAPGKMVDEWVSSLGSAEYAGIAPDGGAVTADLPPGATIIREVIDSSGSVSALTLLVKGPAGYNPAIGDWWWGVTDPDGVPAVGDAGLELGRLTQCYSCHVPRQAQDFLFGVPLDDRASGGSGENDGSAAAAPQAEPQ